MSIIWTFKTARFEVYCEAVPERDVDVSWADAETIDLIERGVYSVLSFHVGIILDGEDGVEVSSQWLSNSVYEDASEFVREHRCTRATEREHFARAGQQICIGAYFPDMVRAAVADARRHLRHLKLREGA